MLDGASWTGAETLEAVPLPPGPPSLISEYHGVCGSQKGREMCTHSNKTPDGLPGSAGVGANMGVLGGLGSCLGIDATVCPEPL